MLLLIPAFLANGLVDISFVCITSFKIQGVGKASLAGLIILSIQADGLLWLIFQVVHGCLNVIWHFMERLAFVK